MQVFHNSYRQVLILITAIVLAACSASDRIVKTYEGQPLPEERLARFVEQENISVVEIDGVKQKQYMLNNLILTYDLLPGEHTVVYRYSSLWSRRPQSDDANEPHADVFESELRRFRIVFQPGKTYTLKFQQPQNKVEAEQLAGQFSAVVVDEAGREIAQDVPYDSEAPAVVVVSPLSPVLSTKAGSSTKSVLAEGAVTNSGSVVAAGAVSAGSVAAAIEAESADQPSVARVVNAKAIAPVDAGLSRLEAIKMLWSKSSPEEKKEFLRWAFH